MVEERDLYAEERAIDKKRIAELEAEVKSLREQLSKGGSQVSSRSASYGTNNSLPQQSAGSGGSNPMSTSSSVDGSQIPQESGRNPDGTPFYAPAPRLPSRTFNPVCIWIIG